MIVCAVTSCAIRLRDILNEDRFKHLEIDVKELPESITLNQTVAVWKHVVCYQEKHSHAETFK